MTGSDVEVAFAAPSSGSPFQWVAFRAVLADGEERSFQVSFRPTSNAIQQATLIVTSSAPGSRHSIGLIGKGPRGFCAPAMISLTPAAVAIGKLFS